MPTLTQDLQRFTDKNARTEIQDVCIKNGHKVATDSYKLIEIETKEPDTPNAANYPDYKQAFPKKDNTILLNAEYLYRVALFIKRHGNGQLELQAGSTTDPVMLYSKTKDGQKIRAAVMPIMQ